MASKKELIEVLNEYKRLGIADQIDYDKFYLYSLITHSTAIEGSTVTEIENQLLFDEGIAAKGRTMQEQLMNLDLKKAYEHSQQLAKSHIDFSVDMLKGLSAIVMKNTGSVYNTALGSFDASKGDLRLVNVTAGAGGKSYLNYQKVPAKLEAFCQQVNERRAALASDDVISQYMLSFDAHFQLVTIHPWVDGNGRMSRLVMNHLQFEFGLIPVKVNKEDKAEYIQALIQSREHDSMEPFREFMLQEHIKNLRHEIENFHQSQEGGQKTEKVDRKGGQETRDAILQMIRENAHISSSKMAERLGINRSAVSKHLKKMQDAGIIRREGPDKGGKWVIIK